VRIAPDKVNITSVDAAQNIWGGQNPEKFVWNKHPEMVRISRGGLTVDNLLSTPSAKDALRMRRVVGPPFAKKLLYEQESIFKDCTKRVMERMEEERKCEPRVDIMHQFMTYAFDVLSMFLD